MGRSTLNLSSHPGAVVPGLQLDDPNALSGGPAVPGLLFMLFQVQGLHSEDYGVHVPPLNYNPYAAPLKASQVPQVLKPEQDSEENPGRPRCCLMTRGWKAMVFLKPAGTTYHSYYRSYVSDCYSYYCYSY